MLLDGYIRVSDVRGRAGDSFISPDVQREKIEAYTRLHGHELGRVWIELDKTGRNTERPMFQQVIQRIEAGETGGIIVAKLDRFARTLVGALEAIHRIEAAGGQLVSVEDSFDTSTPIGRFGFQIVLALAELESGRIRENWRVASARAVARGLHVTPRLPVGYLRAEDGRLVEDPDVAPLIAEAFRMRAAGVSSTRVAEMLNAAGVQTSYGGRWSGVTVRRLTQNRVYLGEARGSFGATNATAHNAIVDEGTFFEAVTTRDRPMKTQASLLAGLLRCAGCRYVMTRSGTRRTGHENEGRYRCRVEHSTGRCPAPTAVHPHVIEDHVVAALVEAAGGGPTMYLASTVDLEPLRTSLGRAETELAMFRDTAAIAELGQDIYLEGLQQRAAIRDHAHQLFTAALDEAEAKGAFERVVQLRDEWDDLEVEDQRELLASAIDVVFLRRGRGIPISNRATILWRGTGPTDLPRRAKPQPIRSFDITDERDIAARIPAA